MNKTLVIVPTFKNQQSFHDLYRINRFDFDRDLELPWSGDLEKEISAYESVYSYADILEYTDYAKLAKYSTKFNTSLCGDYSRIKELAEAYPDKGFGVYFPGKSMYMTQGITWEDYKIRLDYLKDRNQLTSFAYIFHLKNWKNLLDDISAAEEYFDNVASNIMFSFELGDVEYTQSLSQDERAQIKELFTSIFNDEKLDVLGLVDRKVSFLPDMSYIMPDSQEPRDWMQKVDANKDCSFCNPLQMSPNECCYCYLYGDDNNFTLEKKEAYRVALTELRRLLS